MTKQTNKQTNQPSTADLIASLTELIDAMEKEASSKSLVSMQLSVVVMDGLKQITSGDIEELATCSIMFNTDLILYIHNLQQENAKLAAQINNQSSFAT